jgi:hypothetical protein
MSETKRYLRDSDYKKAIFLSELDKVTQGDVDTLLESELDAKAMIESMLSDEYCIEEEFALGESIVEINTQKEYFKGDYVIVDGKTSKAKSYVSGSKPPKSDTYWREMDISEIDEMTEFEPYSQNVAQFDGDIVLYLETYFECLISNGVGIEYGSENIIQPHTYVYWQPTMNEIWDVSDDYTLSDVDTTIAEESGVEYALISPANTIVGKSPSQSIVDGDNAWKLVVIQTYDRTERYVRGNGFDGYVEFNGEYFFVSADDEGDINGYAVDEDAFIFSPTEDPRNRNIVQKMVHLVLHCLMSVVVPNNIPIIRQTNYDACKKWLEQASAMKVNPNIARKTFKVTTVNPVTGLETESEHNASRWAINQSESTRDNWTY